MAIYRYVGEASSIESIRAATASRLQPPSRVSSLQPPASSLLPPASSLLPPSSHLIDLRNSRH